MNWFIYSLWNYSLWNYFEFPNLMRLNHVARIRRSQPGLETLALSAGLIAERRV